MQANTLTLCNVKGIIDKHSTPTPMYKWLMKECPFNNNVEYEFWFCHDDVKHCVSGNKKQYVLD